MGTAKTRMNLIQEAVDENGLDPQSLVGSFCHAYDDGLDPELDLPTAQGRVIAEPQAGTYLVQMFDAIGGPTHQELIGLDRMMAQHWAFFDSQDVMQERYLSLSVSMGAAR